MKVHLTSSNNLSISTLATIARICTTDMEAEPVSKGVDADTKLCEALYKKGHWSVFEHASMTFYVECSRSCSLQLARHRHISRTEASQRYIKMHSNDNMFEAPLKFSAQLYSPEAVGRFGGTLRAIQNCYDELLSLGVAPEDARAVLPECTKTRMFITLNLRTLLELTEKRANNTGAQDEIRLLVQSMWQWLPIEITELFRDILPFMGLIE